MNCFKPTRVKTPHAQPFNADTGLPGKADDLAKRKFGKPSIPKAPKVFKP